MKPAKDKGGREVDVGTHVRVLGLSPSFLASLPENEIADVTSMIGEVFEVYEIDPYGHPWVCKGWGASDEGNYWEHSLALDSWEMEVAPRVRLVVALIGFNQRGR